MGLADDRLSPQRAGPTQVSSDDATTRPRSGDMDVTGFVRELGDATAHAWSGRHARGTGRTGCLGRIAAQAANLLSARSAVLGGPADSPQLLKLLLSGTENKRLSAAGAAKARVGVRVTSQ